MDHGERLTKVEAIVDEHREQMARFEREFGRIHESINTLREHTDRGLAELRLHVDNGFAVQRESTEQGLKKIRQELQKTTRWMVGMAFVYGTVIVAMIGRMGGLY